MLSSVVAILNSLNNLDGLTRTLCDVKVMHREDRSIIYFVGNSALCCRVMIDGEPKLLKCYTIPNKNLQRIYGSSYLHDELFIYNGGTGEGVWIDVVVEPWVEGRPLSDVVVDACQSDDKQTLSRLSYEFNKLSIWLLEQDWAHGDLTPDNIIVKDDLTLQLIDFDAKFMPRMHGERSIEIGTAAFQHPSRDTKLFCKCIDDYSVALISTALSALSLEPRSIVDSNSSMVCCLTRARWLQGQAMFWMRCCRYLLSVVWQHNIGLQSSC